MCIRDRVESGYTLDMMVSRGQDAMLARIHSLQADGGGLNGVHLKEGRLPTAADECVVLFNHVTDLPVALGDKMCIRDRDTPV